MKISLSTLARYLGGSNQFGSDRFTSQGKPLQRAHASHLQHFADWHDSKWGKLPVKDARVNSVFASTELALVADPSLTHPITTFSMFISSAISVSLIYWLTATPASTVEPATALVPLRAMVTHIDSSGPPKSVFGVADRGYGHCRLLEAFSTLNQSSLCSPYSKPRTRRQWSRKETMNVICCTLLWDRAHP
jgi:hypothetical protein